MLVYSGQKKIQCVRLYSRAGDKINVGIAWEVMKLFDYMAAAFSTEIKLVLPQNMLLSCSSLIFSG